jgi:hypothetical protein
MLPEFLQIENYNRNRFDVTDRYVFKIPELILTEKIIVRYFPTFGNQVDSGQLIYSIKIPGFGTYSQESYLVPVSLPNKERFVDLNLDLSLPISLEFVAPAGLKQGKLEVFCFKSTIDLPDFQPQSNPTYSDPDEIDIEQDLEPETMNHPELKPSTYQLTKQARNTFTIDPEAPSHLFVADSRRKQLIFKSLDSSTANFKVVIFDRTHGYPAELGTPYTDIHNELLDEILPGGSLVVDQELAQSDIYVFASVDLAKINVTITELK